MTNKINNKNIIRISKSHIILGVLVFLLFCVFMSRKTCTNENFEIGQEGKLIMFYADWCGHCKRAKPAFEEFMGQTDRADMVDCSTKEMAKKHAIKGFPTYRYYTDSETFVDYTEGRDLKSMLNYVNNH